MYTVQCTLHRRTSRTFSILIKRKRRAVEAAANPTNREKPLVIPYFLCPSFVFGPPLFQKKV